MRMSGMSDAAYRKLERRMELKTQHKLRRLQRREDRERSLAATVLVRTLLHDRYRMRLAEQTFETDEFGKPYLKGADVVHFNTSHSGGWIFCAIDRTSVGVDVERIAPIDLNIAELYFAEEERQDLQRKAEEDKLHYFYDLWTLKESYIKAIGRGLSVPLGDFAIRVTDSQITLRTAIEPWPCFFRQYALDPQYKFAVCALHDRLVDNVELMDWNLISESFNRIGERHE